MSAVGFYVTPESLRGALRALSMLPHKIRQRPVRVSMNAMGGVFKRAAERFAPRETGMLRKSLGVKVKIPDASFNSAHHGKPAYMLVGPRRHFVRAYITKNSKAKLLTDKKALQRVLSGGAVKVRNPSRYAHLAERHTPFLGRAQKAVQRAAIDTMGRRLGREVEIEAAKLANPLPRAA